MTLTKEELAQIEQEAADKYQYTQKDLFNPVSGSIIEGKREAYITAATAYAERAKGLVQDVVTIRNELYSNLPTDKIDAFELLKLIKEHTDKIDELHSRFINELKNPTNGK